ncbi:MAG TPA: Lrp/AsnC family transcriptional regulator [Stellaceae bacterium]|nr:Lrp/AsnC family transcriptional regulator [Stellaceae bacterium]
MEIDHIDRRILRELMADGQVTLAELAGRVGLSSSPCWRRVRALEEAGVIRGYTCSVDAKAVGLGVEVYILASLEKHVEFTIQRFREAVLALPEVIECCSLTGPRDVVIRAVLTDLDALNDFLMTRMLKLPGVAHVETGIVLERMVERRSLPL